MTRHLASNHVRRGRPALNLELLEDRCVPACTVTQAGTAPNVVLTIAGDSGANTIMVSDDGMGTITVICDGVAELPVAGVKDIIVNSGRGNDRVFYTLTADLAAGQIRNVVVDLGDGRDRFLAQNTNTAGVLGTAALSFNVKGKLGNDNLRFDFTDDFHVAAGGVLKVRAVGNAGADRIALTHLGAIDGAYNITLNGGGARDRIGANVALEPASAGAVDAAIKGHGDDDILALLLAASGGFTGTLTGEVDGGGGINTAVVSDLVVVTDVAAENILRLP